MRLENEKFCEKGIDKVMFSWWKFGDKAGKVTWISCILIMI